MKLNTSSAWILAAPFCLAWPAVANAQQDDGSPRTRLDRVQVTASRFAEKVQEVPLAVNVVTGEELRARGATDLRTALSLLAGVSVAPGGDAGPAGALPGILGTREVDDFLLVIDGVPAGGAFIPQFELIDLTNIERIEVIRGAAPVYFGTTAFAGTIHIVHYPAGRAASEASLEGGSYGTVGGAVSTVLSDGPLKQSLSANLARDRQADERTQFRRAQGSYRLATMPSGADGPALRADLSATALRQKPGSPTPTDENDQLTSLLSRDFNQNPGDARIDTDKLQLTLGADAQLAGGQFGAQLSVARSRTHALRGFLNPGFEDAAGDNATGFEQDRRLFDLFFDAHLTQPLTKAATVTWGVNELYGYAKQTSRVVDYFVPLDGTRPEDGAPLLADAEPKELRDRRNLLGVYAQTRWTIDPQTAILAGLRWNATKETRTSADPDDSQTQTQSNSRLSGSIGVTYKLWRDGGDVRDSAVVHAGYGNTFQLPQIDFGPDTGDGQLLEPETQSSFTAGVKVDALDGRLDADLTFFYVNFKNRALATLDANGLPALENGGHDRYRGVDLEASYLLATDLRLTAHTTYSDARYVDFATAIDGEIVQLGGNRLRLTPRISSGFGVTWLPQTGWQASAVLRHTGERYLNRRNTAVAGGFTTVDLSAGYGWRGARVQLIATNLTNRRDPTQLSELGEDQFYRMPGRRILLRGSLAL